MKNILTIAIALFTIGFSANAQEKNSLNKNAKYTIEVNGKCGMCKKRIETAAIKTKGVKYANWDVNTHLLSVIIDERKTNPMLVKNSVAAVGHDTKEVKAKDEVYAEIHPCCKYREDNTNDDGQ
ncbi:heavy-metal-associated domain-containing protein [Sungkyunkwania multivorans]|uniref:Heavy-metal-associated domain-containing protein n=1 Tax=Sungkyunkwania multivorans TaxID=1173618 RepID=A0ABW3D113_9FLAO